MEGVNSLSIQLANAIGCNVYAVAGGPDKVKRAEKLGARAALDYRAVRNWHVEILKMTKGRGTDLVIDNVGAATIQKSLRAVARGGKIVTVGNTSGPDIRYDNRNHVHQADLYCGFNYGKSTGFSRRNEFHLETEYYTSY